MFLIRLVLIQYFDAIKTRQNVTAETDLQLVEQEFNNVAPPHDHDYSDSGSKLFQIGKMAASFLYNERKWRRIICLYWQSTVLNTIYFYKNTSESGKMDSCLWETQLLHKVIKNCMNKGFIHPFIHSSLIQAWVTELASHVGYSRYPPIPGTFFSALPGGFPGMSRSDMSSFHWVLESTWYTSNGRCPGGILTRCPNHLQLAPFQVKQHKVWLGHCKLKINRQSY